jgi:paraquat-inducible protein B
MSKRANTKLIGVFVLGALALVVGGLYVFGAGWFLRDSATFVAYFEGSVMGLQDGAPVTFRGVKVGTVKEIKVQVEKDLDIRISVFMEILRDRIARSPGMENQFEDKDIFKTAKNLIERGLRAQLKLQSYVTGLLYVDLDFYPDRPPRLIGALADIPEIPTIPSKFEELAQTVEKLPLDELINKIMLSLEGIERVVNAPEVMESLRSLNVTLKTIEQTAEEIHQNVQPVGANIQKTLTEVRALVKTADKQLGPLLSNLDKTVVSTNKLVNNMDQRVTTVSEGLQATLTEARKAFQAADKTLSSMDTIVTQDSTSRHQIDSVLKDLAAAARSMRAFADYVERNPEALIRGKR